MKCHSIGALWFESNSIRGSNRHGLELVVNGTESTAQRPRNVTPRVSGQSMIQVPHQRSHIGKYGTRLRSRVPDGPHTNLNSDD